VTLYQADGKVKSSLKREFLPPPGLRFLYVVVFSFDHHVSMATQHCRMSDCCQKYSWRDGWGIGGVLSGFHPQEELSAKF